jgi:hypothetical protein
LGDKKTHHSLICKSHILVERDCVEYYP